MFLRSEMEHEAMDKARRERDRVFSAMQGKAVGTEDYDKMLEEHEYWSNFIDDHSFHIDWTNVLQGMQIISTSVATVIVPISIAQLAYCKETNYELPAGNVFNLATRSMKKA